MTWAILCEEAELAVECSTRAKELGLDVDCRVSESPTREAIDTIRRGHDAAVVLVAPPPLETLVEIAEAAGAVAGTPRIAAAFLAQGDDPVAAISIARDLGIVAVEEVRPLVSALAVLESGVERPWAVALGSLPSADRQRFARIAGLRQSGGGILSRGDDGGVVLQSAKGSRRHPLGDGRDAAEAIVAIHAAAGATGTPRPVYEAVDPARAAGILFGPPRALSGHASKAALGAYGVPTPAEELCASASRAAAEASRMGFPVRITLASPDLRLLEHPDLIVDGLDHATQVRDVFRQLVATAEARVAGARILGVTVSAATVPRATLRARLTPLTHGRVLVDIGFADPHGLASGDHTQTVFPTSVARFERVLGRLAGADLLVDGPAAVRRQTIDAIAQAVLRSSAFVADHADAITAVELDPLVVLADGSAEVRDACIEVSDAFERRLDREAGTGASTANG